jgi:hypothetical protein
MDRAPKRFDDKELPNNKKDINLVWDCCQLPRGESYFM